MTILQHIFSSITKHPNSFLGTTLDITKLNVLSYIFHNYQTSNNRKDKILYCLRREYFENSDHRQTDPFYKDYQDEEVELKEILKYFTKENVFILSDALGTLVKVLLESELDSIKDLDYLDLRIDENKKFYDLEERGGGYYLSEVKRLDSVSFIPDNFESSFFISLREDKFDLIIPTDYLEAAQFYLNWCEEVYNIPEKLAQSYLSPEKTWRRYLTSSYYTDNTDKSKYEKEAKDKAEAVFKDKVKHNKSKIEYMLDKVNKLLSNRNKQYE